MSERRTLTENVVIISCALSAGVHYALVPPHLEENTILGAGFAVSTALLLLAALAIARSGDVRVPAGATAALLGALIVAYGVSRTIGLPVGGEGVEELDALGLATQCIQAAGLAAAIALCRPLGRHAGARRSKGRPSMKTLELLKTRRLSAVAIIIVALAATVPAFAASGDHHHSADEHALASHSHAAHGHALTARELAFHDAMRKLWEDHITWTRLAIVSFTSGLPDLKATEARLLQNQTDIGNAVKPFYGKAAGNQLTALLKQHILGAVDLMAAAKAGDQARVAKASSAWNSNGRKIADFLHSANPRHWARSDMRKMMQTHLDQTLKEAVDRMKGHYSAEIRDYDAVHAHILEMADMLSAGIIEQFPARFR
jgi:hypothetical protein